MERPTSPAYEWGMQWVGMGDSSAAGPGAGDKIDDPCHRHAKGYPQQLQEDYWPTSAINHPMQFIAWTGAVTQDVLSTQIPAIEVPKSPWPTAAGLVTLSIIGNDILFSSILASCIAVVPGSGKCDNKIEEARKILYGPELWRRYEEIIGRIIAKTLWARKPTVPVIYATAYPAFFDADTPQCDNVDFGPLPFIPAPLVTSALRHKMNSLSAEVNVMLAYFIAHVNNQYILASGGISPVIFVDQDEDYTGHRFCNWMVKEPDVKTTRTWFFHMKDSPIILATAADFANVDIARCEDIQRYDLIYQCYIARELHANPSFDLSTVIRPEGQYKVFHPNIDGMRAVAAAVSISLKYDAARRFSRKLSILAIGDSITEGSKHADSGGYRGYLDGLLKLGNQGEFQWFGRKTNGPLGGNLHYEGYPGEWTKQIMARLSSYPRYGAQPNVVLLMTGTNNMVNQQFTKDALGEMKAMLSYLSSRFDRKTLVLVGAIIPLGAGTNGILPVTNTQRRVMEYNAAVKDQVNEARTLGYNTQFVHTSVTQDDREDNVNPTMIGYQKIAHDWMEAMQRADVKGHILDPFAVSIGGPPLIPVVPCQVKPTWLSKGRVHQGKGNDMGPEVACSVYVTRVDNGIKGCTCTDGKSKPYYVELQNNNNCSDMGYRDVHSVHFANIDGDGRADYIYVSVDGQVSVDRNTGVGNQVSFSAAGAVFTFPPEARRHEIQFADLNGDGRADFLWVQPNGSVKAWWNQGSPWVSNPVYVELVGVGSVVGFVPGHGPPGSRVMFADLNADGRAEYIWLENDGGAHVYLNDGVVDGTDTNGITIKWKPQKQTVTGFNGQGSRWRTKFADLNGDKRADLLWMKPDGSTDLWNNGPASGDAGERSWLEMGRVADGVGTPKRPGFQIMFADLDGNGKEDYIYVNPATGETDIWLNTCIT